MGVQTSTDLSKPLGFHSGWINCNRLWERETWTYRKIGICRCPTLVFCPHLPLARSTHRLRHTHNTPNTHISSLLYKCTQHLLIYLYTILNTLDQIFMPKPHDTYRFMLETFICKVSVYGLWHQPFCHLFTSCIQLTCMLTPTHHSHNTQHALEHPSYKHTHAPISTCASPIVSVRESSPPRPATHTPPRVNMHVFPLPSGSRSWASVHTDQQSRGGLHLPPVIDMQHLSSRSGFGWVECQSLPGTAPRAAVQKQLSGENEAP